MAEYKLIYFNFAALAEPIRWQFKVSKTSFEEERINVEEWPQHKARFPLGQMPILIEDGKELTQSASISRYLAKKFGQVTGNEFLDYRVDQVIDIVNDGRLQWRLSIAEKDPKKKEEIKKNLVENVCPKVLKQLADIVSETDGDFIAGDKLTFGDFWLAHWLQLWTSTVTPTLLDDYPVLIRLKKAVEAIPEIKTWLEERPKTAF